MTYRTAERILIVLIVAITIAVGWATVLIYQGWQIARDGDRLRQESDQLRQQLYER